MAVMTEQSEVIIRFRAALAQGVSGRRTEAA
jgi:hypothetical protein